MNFRSSTTSWKDSGQNLQRSSYEYGYGGGRTDLPAVGYNPVYPSFTSSDYNNWGYTPTPIGTAPKPPQQENNSYGYQASFHNYQQEEYNPVYPSYQTRQQPQQQDSYRYRQEPVGHRKEPVDQRPVTLVRVNQSAFSVTNTLKTRPTPYVVPIPRATTAAAIAPAVNNNNTTNGVGGVNNKRKKKKKTKKAPVAPLVLDPAPSAAVVVDPAAPSPAPKPVSETPAPRQETSTSTAVEPIEVTSYIKEAPMSTPRRGTFPRRSGQGGGVQKRYSNASNSASSFSMNPWDGNWSGAQGSFGGGGFRGGYRGGWRRGWAPRPQNKQDDIPFEAMPEGTETLSFTMDPENINCFHGPSSVFTTQHQFPVLVGGKIYESVDHYYQYKKVQDLCGNVSDKLTEMIRDSRGRRLDGKFGVRTENQPYSQVAREQLKLNNVDKKKVEEWRVTKGLAAVQEALLAKAGQSAHLREALTETGGKILVHAYSGDSIYGTGATIPVVKKWVGDMKNNGTSTFSIPATFPLTAESVKSVPVFSRGRNILGVILMQIRDMVSNGNVNIVDLTAVFDAIKKGDDIDELLLQDLEIDGGTDFSIGGGNVQETLGL